MLRLVLLLIGLFALVGIIWHIGPLRLLMAIQQLGPLALIIILAPMLGVYLLDTLGWRLTMGSYARYMGFGQLFAIRIAGESVNMTTPTGYVGGEPIKAYLLKRYGVPLVEGLASVITAKTTMTIAEVVFILLGLGLAFWLLDTSEYHFWAGVMSLGLLIFGVGLFVFVQRYGLGSGLLQLLRTLRLRIAFLEAREAQLRELDQNIQSFYTERRKMFALSLFVFFVGWTIETLEVYAILYFLDAPVDLLTSLSIAALTVLIKGGTFFIPGSLGAQEGGYLVLLLGFGYSDVTGITFALIRRVREILWIGVGFVFLAVLKENPTPRATP